MYPQMYLKDFPGNLNLLGKFLGMAAMPFPLWGSFDIEDDGLALFIITNFFLNLTYNIPCNDIIAC